MNHPSASPSSRRLARRRALGLLAVFTVAGSLSACGASGGSDSADKTTITTAAKKVTTTTEEATTTTEEETTTTAESEGPEETDRLTYDFEDDSEDHGWDTGADQKGAVGIEEGAYYTDVAPNAQFFLQSDELGEWETGAVAGNLTVSKVGQGSPLFGITCFTQHDDSGKLSAYYDLLVSGEGNASIYKNTTGQEPVAIMEKTAIDGFSKDEAFVLTLSCAEGDDGVGLDVRFNGEEVGTVVDDDDPLPPGAVYLETWGDEKDLSTVYFDQVQFIRFD